MLNRGNQVVGWSKQIANKTDNLFDKSFISSWFCDNQYSAAISQQVLGGDSINVQIVNILLLRLITNIGT